MGDHSSESGLPISLTAVLALVTCIGGLWFAYRSPTSGRPNPPQETAAQSIANQAIQARLWQDPLDWKTNAAQARGAAAFSLLRAQTKARASADKILLLPVMLEGGPYSEDRESRIRSRFAIVSALGQSGYAPEDEDHIGALLVPWPNASALDQWLAGSTGALRLLSPINESLDGPGCQDELPLSFEWYRSRVFNAHSDPAADKKVLVLWLNEDQFKDCPHARLALLLNELANTNAAVTGGAVTNITVANTSITITSVTANNVATTTIPATNSSITTITTIPATNAAALNSSTPLNLTNLFAVVKLIGPRSSTTLRDMLPPFAINESNNPFISTNHQTDISNVLHGVDVFCPTPSAMDAVLVPTTGSPPRAVVEKSLTNLWFRSFHNFAATDAQLANEALDELKLRHIDLAQTNQHLVLISEWDTFYGRMLELTYAAELACFQQHASNDQTFIADYLAGRTDWPANLHCFAYLRGLDGQATVPKETKPTGPDSLPKPSLTELVAGDPNESKPEGEAQYDYMIRLGDQLTRLQDRLRASDQGQIDAIGICGNDPYDTLVILQVLRPCFPNVVFFTTDLDARFSHPKEQSWSRNLVVLSSYGLQLKAELQGSVPPFRESDQTAQFAATLAALGNPTLAGLDSIPPRRFEIGRDQAFDLSVKDGGAIQPSPPAGDLKAFEPRQKIVLLVTALLSGAGLVFCSCRWLQRMTADAKQYEIECLWLRMDDVGGRHGITRTLQLLERFDSKTGDPVAHWLWQLVAPTAPNLHKASQDLSLEEAQNFLDLLNQRVLQNGVPLEHVMNSKTLSQETKNSLRQLRLENQSQGVFLEKNSAQQMRQTRHILHDLFIAILDSQKSEPREVLVDEPRELTELAEAAQSARLAGEQNYRLRRNERLSVMIGFPLLLAISLLLLYSAFTDSQPGQSGEPFYFFKGISVWPTEILRLLASVLAVFFVARSYISLRSGTLSLTRTYRLPLTSQSCTYKWRLPSTPPPQAQVKAQDLWLHYQQLGRFWQRVGRVLPLLGLYFVFCVAISYLLGDIPYRPVRGIVANYWDRGLQYVAFLTFLFLAFWIIDAACLCRWLVERFSESPTQYPAASLRYFAQLRGLESKEERAPSSQDNSGRHETILAEWIDMQLIAELTTRVGQLVYFPFIIIFILILSRNQIFARWPSTQCLLLVVSLNLALCAASMLILRQSALRAREIGLENLRSQVEALEREANPSSTANQAAVGRRLLDELKELDKGAFAPIWQNPVVSAILIPSGGSVLIELLAYLFH